MNVLGLLRRVVVGGWNRILLCIQVIISFGSLWMFCTILSDEPAIPGVLSTFSLGHWLQYLLGGFEFIGGVAILFPELCAFGTLVLLPTWGILLVSKTLATENSMLETAMVISITIVASGKLTQVLGIFRTKSLGIGFFIKRDWWRSGLYYSVPSILVLALVGTLFFFFQKSEWGKYDAQGADAINQGNYPAAISNFEEAIRIAERFPRSNWRALQSMSHLGVAYLRSNQVTQAETIFREAVQRSRIELDPNHPLYYQSIHGLASVLSRQLRFPEAESLYLQAVASYASWSPPATEDTLIKALKALKVIGTWLNHQETIVESEKGIRQANDYNLTTQISGLPAVLDSLAIHYLDQRQFKKAEDYYKRALSLKGQILGGEFPDLAERLLSTNLILDENGKPLEGLALYDKFRSILGHISIDNLITLEQSLNNIGHIYWEQGRQKEAEPLYLLSLAIKQYARRGNTPSYAMTLTNLGQLYNSEGRYEDSERKLLEALAIRERTLDMNHPDLAHSYNNLALLYDNQNQFIKAVPLYEKALALRQKSLGQAHPKTVLTLGFLADLYFREVQLSKAEPLFMQLLQIRQQELGSVHPTVLTLMWKLAGIYSEQGKYQESLTLYEQMIHMTEEQFGSNNSTTTQILSSYADVLKQAGKLKEFEQVRKRLQELNSDGLPPPIRPLQKPKHEMEKRGKLT